MDKCRRDATIDPYDVVRAFYWTGDDEQSRDDKHVRGDLENPRSAPGAAGPKFTDDAAAQTFVIERDLVGGKPHLLTIYLTGFPVGQPLDLLVPEFLWRCEGAKADAGIELILSLRARGGGRWDQRVLPTNH